MTKQGHEAPTGQAKITSGYNLPAKSIAFCYLSTGSQIKVIFNVFKEEDLLIYRRLLEISV